MATRVFSALVLGVFALAVNCSSDEKRVGLAEGCHLNTDCNDPLSCTFGKCHKACETTRDCPDGEHCLKVAGGNVCQQPAETTCTFTSNCPEPLKCAVDSKCRVECQEARDCIAGQKCVSSVCADPEEVDPSTMDLHHTTPDDGGDAAVATASEAGSDASTGAGGSAGGGGPDGSDGAATAVEAGADAEGGLPFHGIYTSANGNDTGAGTSAQPYATLAKAASMAKSGDTIVLQDGTYPTSGPAVAIPDGVSLKAENTGLATLQGTAGSALKLAGSTTIQGVVFKNYANVVDFAGGSTAAGTLTITGSSFINCSTACLVIPGSVSATISAATADTVLADGGTGFLQSSGTATVSISGGVLKNFTGTGVIKASGSSKVTVDHVNVTDGSAQAIALSGNGQVTMTNSTVATLAPQLAVLQGTSSLTVKASDLSIKPAVATPYECIRVEMDGVGSVVLEDTKIHGCSTGINSNIPGILSLLRTEIYNNTFAGMDLGRGFVNLGGKVTITDSKFHDNGTFGFAIGSGSSVMDFKMRGTEVASGIGGSASDAMRIDGSPSSTYDFGTLASAGGNTIIGASVNAIGLRIMMSSVMVTAVGNTWSPNIQGADAQGKYTATGAGMSLDVVSPVTGQNYALAYTAVTLRLAQNP